MLPKNYRYFVIAIVLLSLVFTIYFQSWGTQRVALSLGLLTTIGTYLYYFNTIKKRK